MNPPFTTQQFLDVITRYNEAVWPMQVVLYLLAALMIYRAARTSVSADRWVAAALALLWAWMGIVYNGLFFTEINPAAWLFGILFLAAAAAFAAVAVRGRFALRFEPDAFGFTGAAFLAYALAAYPILGALAGHPYPDGPTFGLPCPTTIMTFGLLLWATMRVPWWAILVPAIWSLIGGSAAFRFGIPEDYGLIVAGVVGTALIIVKNRRLP